ncbi:hypothetical protein FKM82_013510 [Ascaphus truei]
MKTSEKMQESRHVATSNREPQSSLTCIEKKCRKSRDSGPAITCYPCLSCDVPPRYLQHDGIEVVINGENNNDLCSGLSNNICYILSSFTGVCCG